MIYYECFCKKAIEWARCPYCGKSDGNDDIILNKKIEYNDYSECKIIVEKQCDICGKKYNVEMIYNFLYENTIYEY